MDRNTKNGLWDFYVKECNDKGSISDTKPSKDECDEPYNKNQKNSCSDSFLKPYLDAQEGNRIYNFKESNQYSPQIPVLAECDIRNPNELIDDPNITIEEYIRLEEEKARRRGKVFNWETAKISFDDSDDEDHTVIFDKNSFSYKIISVNSSENDNEKVNMPSLPSPEPTVSCFDDLDFFNDFENEFSAIVYNDALTSKSDLSTELTLCPQHINHFDLKDETSLSEYDEKEQNILYFNDLFPFNIIQPDDVKAIRLMAPLPPRDQRHLWLRYQVNRVHLLDFEGLTPDIRQDLAERMRMVYTGDDGYELGGARRSITWRHFILALGLHTAEEMAENGFKATGAPSYTYIKDPVRRLCNRLISYSISGRGQAPEQYLFRHAEGRKSGAKLYVGHFIGRLAHHFGLVSDDGLKGLSVVARELPLIDMGELVKLNICMEIGDDWAWVALLIELIVELAYCINEDEDLW
ncbi:hypothetical protein Tco_0542489 [Tanacetum coccineum]